MSKRKSENTISVKRKIVFLGNTGVGKTSLINRFMTSQYHEDQASTIGIDFNSKTKIIRRDGSAYKVTLQLWDTAGQDRFLSLLPNYVRAADIIILVYSKTDPESFNSLQKWLNEINSIGEKVMCLVGNKTDNPKNIEESKLVPNEKGQEFKVENNCRFFLETSAKDNANVDELLGKLYEVSLDYHFEKGERNSERNRLEGDGSSFLGLLSCC